MQERGLTRPSFDGQEMADLVAFLYSVRSAEPGGSPRLGEVLYAGRGCDRCHGARAEGTGRGPGLRGRGKRFTSISFAAALWRHGPHIYGRAREQRPGLARALRGRRRRPDHVPELLGDRETLRWEFERFSAESTASPSRGFAAAFVLAGGATTALTLGGRRAFFRPAVRQPISFNHKKHVTELDLACTTCHAHGRDGSVLGPAGRRGLRRLPPRAAGQERGGEEARGDAQERNRSGLEAAVSAAGPRLLLPPPPRDRREAPMPRLPRRDRGHHRASRPRETPRDERLRLVPPKSARLDGLHGVSPMRDASTRSSGARGRRAWSGGGSSASPIGAAAGTALGIPAGSIFSGILGSAESPIYPPKGAGAVRSLRVRPLPRRVRRAREEDRRACRQAGGQSAAPRERRTALPEGQAGLQGLYHPDRLPGPLRRVGPRGSLRSFERTSWESALGVIAARLRSLQGPEAPRVARASPERNGRDRRPGRAALPLGVRLAERRVARPRRGGRGVPRPLPRPGSAGDTRLRPAVDRLRALSRRVAPGSVELAGAHDARVRRVPPGPHGTARKAGPGRAAALA